MRLFIALPAARSCRQQIWGLMERLCRRDPKARWERPEKLHLTLAFLGAQPEERAAWNALSSLEGPAFSLTFSHLGRFPGEKGDILFLRPEPSPPLHLMQRRLRAALEREGIVLENRPFVPHITLARRAEKKTEWERIPLSPLVFPAKTVSLMESVPVPGGTRYQTLCQIPLKQTDASGKERPIL